MIFLDESGDEGTMENSSTEFFVVSIVGADAISLKNDYFLIKEKLGITKKDYKWNSLKKSQKEIFYKIAGDVSYRVNVGYVDKSKYINDKKMYFDLSIFVFGEVQNGDTVVYTGDHLGKMFDKVRRLYKKKNIKISFREARTDEVYGVSIADLWAGYIHYLLKNKIKIPKYKNIKVREFRKS